MPLALLLIGIIFLTAAARGTHQLLFDTLKDDFTGPDNFIYWGLALFVIGAVGYYKPLKPISTAFMTLVIVVLFLSNRGFFEQFMRQIAATNHPAPVSNKGSGLGGVLSEGAGLLQQGANALNSIFGGK